MKKRIRKHKALVLIGALIIVLGVAVTFFVLHMRGRGSKAEHKTQKENTVSLEKMDLTTSVSATGTIQSKSTKTVSAEVNGVTVSSVLVSVGDEVSKGDVLVNFDKTDLQSTLSDAKDNLSDVTEEANRSLTSAKKQLSEAKETYEDEKEKAAEEIQKAKKEYKSAKKQVSSLKKQISSEKNAEAKAKLQEELTKAQETMEQAKNSYETAVSNRDNTNKQNKNSISNAKESVTTAEANKKKNVKEAQKQVDEAEEALENCSVTAPISGTVTAMNVSEGDTYSGGSMIQIDDTSSYTVSTTVDEYDISDVKKGQRVVILTEATGDDEIEGEISFVAPSTGSTSLSSGQSGDSSTMGSSSSGYEIDIDITTKDDRLKMGLTAKCSIILEEADDVFAVPYDAVHENSDGTTVVYVSEQNGDSTSSREVQVTKGMESDYYVEVSGDELTEGMQIIIPTDETSSSSDTTSEDSDSLGLLGGMSGGGGDMGGKQGGGGGMPGGGNGGGGGMPGK